MDWSGLRWRTNSRLRPSIRGDSDCFVRTDWAGIEQDGFACCAISMAARARVASSRGFAGKLALHCSGETQQGEVTGRCLAHGAESFPPSLMHGRSRYRRRGSSGTRSTKGTLRQLPQ